MSSIHQSELNGSMASLQLKTHKELSDWHKNLWSDETGNLTFWPRFKVSCHYHLPNSIPTVNHSHACNILWGSLSTSRDRETSQGLQEPVWTTAQRYLNENDPLSGLKVLLSNKTMNDTKHKPGKHRSVLATTWLLSLRDPVQQHRRMWEYSQILVSKVNIPKKTEGCRYTV